MWLQNHARRETEIALTFKCECIQGVPGRKVNFLGGRIVGHSNKNIYMNMFPIPNGFRGRAI